MKASFWKDKKVFLTGHTGFKGSWLALWLQQMGAQVTGYSLPPTTNPNLFELANVADGMTASIEGDIRDADSLRRTLSTASPDIVLHLAAQALVRRSYKDPLETYTTNVIGTANVLESVRVTPGVKIVINVTSDKCYENREWVWGYRENEPMGGHDPYSSSKGCAELVAAAYRHSFFETDADVPPKVAVASVRAGNVIGGGDWSRDRLIPDIMKSIISGEAVPIRYPEAIRPWQHVLEPLSGYLLLAQRLWMDGKTYAGAWNFGPNDRDARPVAYICDTLTGLWGEGAHWRHDPQPHPHEATYLKLDCSKAHLRLGWQPRMDLKTALHWIVRWYRALDASEDMGVYCLAEIERYHALLGNSDESFRISV
jgi:CDP-glucose 4,6-dehydratase